MCANYLPATPAQLLEHFGVAPPDSDYKSEAFPGYLAPMIRKPRADAGVGERSAALAMFGMVPHWADIKLARQTYNARTETVATKPSFRSAFKHGQFCIIPAATIFEPSYETGKSERFGIGSDDGTPLGIAGIWEHKTQPDTGLALLSFSMLTINANDHPLMRRFHKPDDEKRMLILLHPQQYDDWLHCLVDEAPSFFNAYPAEQLAALPAPRSARSIPPTL